jgi:zinc/manganese transport system permease protein
MSLFSNLELSIIAPAFLAGLLVLTTHVPLGRQVLSRGIIFLDLAIAQIAGLGVIIAYSLGWEAGGWQVQLIALGAALSGALLLYASERLWEDNQEAIIGCVFVLAASAGLLVLSSNPHGGEALKDLLAGQILWVTYSQLIPVGIIYAAVLALWFGLGAGLRVGRGKQQSPLLFYALFAISVTTSVQLVGVYLVFASLIMPALAVQKVRQHPLLRAYITGAGAYAAGLMLSALWDLPSGATIVCTMALICGLSFIMFSAAYKQAPATTQP